MPGNYSSRDPESFRYKLAVTAIIKNESRYLAEWIDYHLLAGIDHFYLYNNGSTDSTAEVLKPYIENGTVDLIDFPGQVKQLPAYHDALHRYMNECKYMAFIDADEFIRPLDAALSIYDVTERVLSSVNDPKAVGMIIPWRVFGSSGYVDMPTGGGVINNFLYRADDNRTWNSKVIINPRRVIFFMTPHYVSHIHGNYIVDEQGRKHGTAPNVYTPQNICIHHYYTKSKAEWIERRSSGRADIAHIDKAAFRSMDEFYSGDHKDIYDDSMLYYAGKLQLTTYQVQPKKTHSSSDNLTQ